ncbi:hypothetical protein TNCV_2661741 [Trichonephila clavipes]|nr:hypothetical protein TNCV_2661741 [Trichonephila clavipes]
MFHTFFGINRSDKRFKSCFGSTYLCESFSFTMNTIKSTIRSRLNDSNLKDAIRLEIASYMPDFEKLEDNMQCQKSH